MTGPHIRIASEADIPEMHRIRLSVRENPLTKPELVRPEHYRAMLAERGRGWVAESEGRIVGFAIADRLDSNIWALFMDPAFERRGVGRRLHDTMLDWLFAEGAERLWLATAPGTRAERFYRSSGWRHAGPEPSGEARYEMTRQDWSHSRGARMDDLRLTQAPVMKTGMLIRKPVAEVFEAFVDPGITTRFWFTKGSGRLEEGKQVQWEWEMYGISIPVTVKAVEPNRRLVVEWPGHGSPTIVEWTFQSLADGTTFVRITNSGFAGDGDAVVRQAMDSTQGFTLVLAGAKALLEHGVRLNLVPDRYPKGIEEH